MYKDLQAPLALILNKQFSVSINVNQIEGLRT